MHIGWSPETGKLWMFVCVAVYKIILGTLENEASADIEWQHARYLRTAKKRKFLSTE